MFVIAVAAEPTGLIGLACNNRVELFGLFLFNDFELKINAELNIRR